MVTDGGKNGNGGRGKYLTAALLVLIVLAFFGYTIARKM
jgi:Tfp pilus assembly protein PilX